MADTEVDQPWEELAEQAWAQEQEEREGTCPRGVADCPGDCQWRCRDCHTVNCHEVSCYTCGTGCPDGDDGEEWAADA